MEPQETFILDFLRHDGKRETVALHGHTVMQAQAAAERIFNRRRGRYLEVDIRTEHGHVETLSDLHANVEELQQI